MDENEYFKEYGYCIIKNAVSKETANFLAANFEMWRDICIYRNSARMDDGQVTNAFAEYNFLAFETLLAMMVPKMESVSGKKLYPTNSYARIYSKGSELKIHKDRPGCEYSATMTLFQEEKNPWPIWVTDFKGQNKEIYLDSGDMCMYHGPLVDHWRNPYKGNKHIQVFLHYVDADGPYASEKYDSRKMLGLNKNE